MTLGTGWASQAVSGFAAPLKAWRHPQGTVAAAEQELVTGSTQEGPTTVKGCLSLLTGAGAGEHRVWSLPHRWLWLLQP